MRYSAPLKRILILELDEVFAQQLCEFLYAEGYEVAHSTKISEAERWVSQCWPAILIISEDMPPPEGVEVLPLLRALTNSPIIVMGEGGEVPTVTALLDGADAYVRKPVDHKVLLSRIRSLLRHFDHK